MEKALNYILANAVAVNSLVGDHISPIKRDDVDSSVTYELTSNQTTVFASGQTSGMQTSEFAIIARSQTYKKTKSIVDAIKSTLTNIKGDYAGVKIHLCIYNNEQQNQYIEQEISEITLTYTFYHN
jgi:hypothetical protein